MYSNVLISLRICYFIYYYSKFYEHLNTSINNNKILNSIKIQNDII